MVDDQDGGGSSLDVLTDELPSLPASSPGRSESGDTPDRARLPLAVGSLMLLLLGLLGWAFGSAEAKAAGFVLFALIGFGSACVIGIRRVRWPALAFSAPLGLAFVLLMGFVLVEAKVWPAGTPLFAIAVAIAAAMHLSEVARALGARLPLHRSRRPVLSSVESAPMPSEGPESGSGSPKHAAAPAPVPADSPDGSNGLALPTDEPVRLNRLKVATLALVIAGLAICLLTATTMQNFVPHGLGAVLTALPVVWYIGIAIVIAGVVVGIVASGWVAGVAVTALQLAVTLTPAIMFALPRYSWTFKHIGITKYVLFHGAVNPTVDIYQSWPGLFAGVAWVCHAVGIHDPTPIARWWPAVIDVAVLLAVQRLAFRILGDVRRSWLAAALVVVGNMIGQDYFSPQAAGFLISIAVFAAVYRRRSELRRLEAVEWVTVIGLVIAVVVTHQLSPYMIGAATTVLAVFGFCRSRLVPVASFVLAGGWALLHFNIVRRYFNFKQFGDLTTNVLTKGFIAAGVHKGPMIRLDSYAMAVDAGIIGILALLVLLQRRDKLHLAIAICAASGSGLFVANSYGNEGAFRVVMFALPWLAILASDWNAATAPRLYWLPAISLPLLLGTYLIADWGLDFMTVMRPGDLAAEQAFEMSAPAGSKLFILGNGYLPAKTTYRYDIFKFRNYPYIVTNPHLSPNGTLRFSPRESFDTFMANVIPARKRVLHRTAYYVISASAPEAAAQELSLSTASQYAALTQQFLHSADWKVVAHTSTAYLFKLVSFFGDTVRPSILGTAQDGAVLTANRGAWPSLNALRFSYQWESCNEAGTGCLPIPGADHNSLELHAPEIGHRVLVMVRATDSRGLSRQAPSKPSAVVGKPLPPAVIEAPTVVGTPARGGRLIVHVGKWHSPDKLHFLYQWEECTTSTSGCTPLSGRTKANLIMRKAYVGHYIRVVVTGVDQENQPTQVAAVPVGPVAP